MIAKGKSISHSSAAIEYGKNKKEIFKDSETGKVTKGKLASFEVDRNLIFGETATEIASDFKIFQRGSTIKNNTFSFVVSPSPEIGATFTQKDWRILTRDFINKMGKLLDVPNLDEQQAFISFVHTGTKTRHLHIFMNRILPNNKPIKDSFVGKKATLAAEQIALERGYKTAKQIRAEQEMLKSLEPEAIYIKQTIDKVMKTFPKTKDQFLDVLNQHNIKSELRYDSNQILRGLSFIYQDKKYKATYFDRCLSGNKLESTLEKNYSSISRHSDTLNIEFNQPKIHNDKYLSI